MQISWRIFFSILMNTSLLLPEVGRSQTLKNHFAHYTTKDGLGEGELYGGIVQDTSGFIWIGTHNGLSRFDGQSFKTFRYVPSDTNSLRENSIRSILIDKSGRLWVLTGHWIYLYHQAGEWFEHFYLKNFQADNLLRFCAEKHGQLIIIGQFNAYQFDIRQRQFSHLTDIDTFHGPLHVYFEDEAGIKWLGVRQGLLRYNPGTREGILIDSMFTKPENDRNHGVDRIIRLSGGNLLATVYGRGLLIVDRATGKYTEYPISIITPDSKLESLNPTYPINDRIDYTYSLNDSIIMCSCSGSIALINWHRFSISYIKHDQSDPNSLLEADSRIYSILKDKEGIVWLGGNYLEKHDISDYQIKKHTVAPPSSRRPFAPYFDLYRCKDGRFLVAGYRDVGIYDTNNVVRARSFPHRINYFKEDGRGNTWCYSMGSICTVGIKDHVEGVEKCYIVPDDPHGFYDLILDSRGRVLLATGDKGLVIFDTSKKSFSFINKDSKAPAKLAANDCSAIFEDHLANIWIGSTTGISKIDKEGRVFSPYLSTLIAACTVNSIAEDRQGFIWFSTQELGIGRIDPLRGKVRFFSVEQGLPTTWFEKICIDDQGKLWAVSRMGLLSINTVSFQNKMYTVEQDFPGPDTINTIHFSTYNHKLYILTPSAILEVAQQSERPSTRIPPPIITEISVFGHNLFADYRKTISLDYDQNFISLHFACLLFHDNNQIKYCYRMQGIDKDWVYCNYSRMASYTNLPPGQYTFMVKAQNPEGKWNEQATILPITILPPFWKTWWFYLVESLAVAVLAIWIVRLYTAKKLSHQRIELERLQAISDERMRIAADMHDDLGAGLTSIRLLSEVTRIKANDAGFVAHEISKIVKSADNLSESLREIIWSMNTNFDSLDDFIIYVRNYAATFLESSQFEFELTVPPNLPTISLPGATRRNLVLCIKEALNNCVKHSGGNYISMKMWVVESTLFIEIQDNGNGISSHGVNYFGNGLQLMQKRLERFGGRLHFDTKNGTRIILSVSISN